MNRDLIVPHMLAIQKAAAKRVCLRIAYKPMAGMPSKRVVEPYELRNTGGDIVLFGYCLDKKAIRKFYLSCIAELEETDIGFLPRWEIKIRAAA